MLLASKCATYYARSSVCFLFQGMKPNAEATDESEVRSSSLHHFVEMVSFPKRWMQGWNGFASSSESSRTVSVRQICHAVAPEKHLLQHIVSVRGVHSSVKPGWFLSSNKAQCQPMGCNTSEHSLIPEGSLSGCEMCQTLMNYRSLSRTINIMTELGHFTVYLSFLDSHMS